MHIIIDGDGPLYRAAAAAQHYEYYIDGVAFRLKKDAVAHAKENGLDETTIVKSDLIIEEEYAAIHNINSIMGTLLSDLSLRTYTLYLGGAGNYRYQINPEYKAGRPPRPVHYDAVKRYIIKKYDGQIVNGWEADDACSMEMYEKPDSVLVSNDKDLLMVPGHHYNWQKQIHTDITETEGMLNFYNQLLSGDSTDNIPGLYALTGQKCTAAIKNGLQFCIGDKELWDYVLAVYQEHDPEVTEQQVDDIARQLWMSRKYPDDWRKPE
jgi:hypothetical protein